MNQFIKIAIIDNSITWRFILINLLEKHNDFIVVLGCDDDEEFINKINAYSIDVLIIDFNFPKKDGISVLIKLKSILKNVPIIVFSTIFDKTLNQTFYDLGIHYYISKSTYEELEKTIYSIFKLDYKERKKKIELSESEIILLKHICEEVDKNEICEKLCISLSSYEKKRKALADKLKIKNSSVSLAMWAVKNNILK